MMKNNGFVAFSDRNITKRGFVAGAIAALLATIAACDSQPTGPSSDHADLVMAITSQSLTLQPAGESSADRYVQPCPDGGQMVVEGSFAFTSEDQVFVHRWDQTMRQEDCAMTANGRSVVANGAMHVFGEARFGQPVDGTAPILMQESGQTGTMTVTVDDKSFTCDYDLTHTYEPQSDDYRITGTICERAVDLHVPKFTT
jgi:hypothetical protein